MDGESGKSGGCCERLSEGTSNNSNNKNINKTTLSTPFVAQTQKMRGRVVYVCVASIVLLLWAWPAFSFKYELELESLLRMWREM